MTLDRALSFTAAETFPVKLFMNPEAGELVPIHLQWFPTNRCNLNCSFCSCSERDKNREMPVDTALKVIEQFCNMGCRAVTITGGGEPLCHPHLTEMILEFSRLGIKIGLVTNGTLFDSLAIETVALLTWCRISNADSRRFTGDYEKALDRVVEVPIDWAFSHIVSRKPNLPEIGRVVDYANNHQFTHVRLVGDLLNPEAVPFDIVQDHLIGRDPLVIYQPRKQPTKGSECLIGYVKPVVAPDFKMYLCCGVQYALKPMSKTMPDDLCMGDARHLDTIYDSRKPFDVSCSRCYYEQYNTNLATLIRGIQHAEFV